ncbi:Sugar phosphate isomerase/epimerase [Alteromonadaceae bacterium Bs31]|nr:Sugar phosphate isomerase/epimerase [Alteromonadaceae bacterium Bs31]
MLPYLGLRAHDFGTLPAPALATAISKSGASCVQLALAKALPSGPLLPSEIGDEGIKGIKDAFYGAQLGIAVLGCYIDMVCLDQLERERALQRFEAHLAAAAKFNCRIVGTETGSPLPYGTSQQALEAAFLVAQKGLVRLIRSAEKSWEDGEAIYVGVEPVAEIHALSSTEHVRRLLKAADSPAVGIIFDPTNLIPRNGISNMDTFLDDCFDAFGERIVAIHAKDYRMVPGEYRRIKSGPIPAGEGEMDWEGVFKRVAQVDKKHVPILLEETGPDKAKATFAFLEKVAEKTWLNDGDS